MGDDSLPYRAEYAKSGRAACKMCKEAIAKDSLRLAVMVQSPFFDGKQPNWHHFQCFFNKWRPKDTAEIAHYESLRWEDQEKIKKKIDSADGVDSSVEPEKGSKKKGKKRVADLVNLQDFNVGYAKSAKSKCRLCEEFIGKNEIRISKKDYNSERALQYGPLKLWHHIDCFVKVREELQYFACGSNLPGYKTLSPEDQQTVKQKVPEMKRTDNGDGPSPSKRLKTEVPDKVKSEMKKQNETMFKYRDQLEGLQKSELIYLLEHNNQEVPKGMANILDSLADVMTFGALEKCEKCGGQFAFKSGIGYKCKGHISEWARCENKTSKPARVPFKVPKELKDNYDFLKKFKGKPEERVFVESAAPPKEEVKEEAETESSPPLTPFKSLQFLIHKSKTKSVDDLKSQIKELGGKAVSKFDSSITAIISTEDELNRPKLAKVLGSAKESDVPVLSPEFFSDICDSTSREELILRLTKYKISPWGEELEKRLPSEKEPMSKKSAYPKKSDMFKSGEAKKKVTLKDGLVVDPDSDLDKVAHVYRSGKDIYSIVLSLADVQKNKNSYYKLQILEGDKKKKYWLFRAWGRIGTTIGGNKVERYSTVEECIKVFKELFEERTGNVWELRNDFKKIPGKMMMLEVSYNEEKTTEVAKSKPEAPPSTLHKSVQELVSLIFDIEAMKKTMIEFELDLVKMPLGKISQNQIHNAFSVLSELQDLIKTSRGSHLIADKTNKFYTLVPHDFGMRSPPLLNTDKLIQQKLEILNNLMEIEIAYKLLQECEGSENSIDDHYRKLNTEIVVLDRSTEEFKIIEAYVKNTHAKTHMHYTMEIQEVFKIERKGEAKRYKQFQKLPNRKLLWHGSRITNFAGILSQGLRIAPPEAPSSGYMFGKGIYFADMVSKSANYCMTSKQNPTGLLLLCEVALGQMHELTKATYIEKLPSGKHSVKGLGKTEPDPKKVATTPTGAEVPLGSGVDAPVKNTSLLYNEYIVYDVSQVKIQYLVRLKFNHKL